MKPRLPAVASIVMGVAGAALVAVIWPIAIPLGIFAVALVAVTFLLKPADKNDKRLATAGLVLGLFAIVLGAAVAVTDDGNDAKDAGNEKLTFVDGIATGTPDAAHPPQKDVENPLPCRVEIGALRAGGKISNSTNAPADYVIIVVWEEDGTRLASNTAVVDNVAPGLTSMFEVSASGDGSLRTTCRAERVDRTPAR